MRQKIIIFFIIAGLFPLIFTASQAQANIVIKVRALNPLESEETAAISYPLPKEISSSDIVSKNIVFSLPREEKRENTFNVEYVQEEGRYYIIDEILLGPREVVTLEVRVRDIWEVPSSRLIGIKRAVENLMARFVPKPESPPEEEGEPVEAGSFADETVKALREEILRQFDEIAARQANSSVLKVGVEQHMEAYYENMKVLAQAEADVAMLRNLLEPEEEEEEESGEALEPKGRIAE